MFNPRELDVLNTLSKFKKPMMVTDIVNKMPELTQSTVSAVLRKLLREGFVKVDGVEHSGKVLSRTYVLSETAKDAIIEHFVESYKMFSDVASPEELYEELKK